VVVEELVVCLWLQWLLLAAAEEQFWHDHNNTQIAGQQAHHNENSSYCFFPLPNNIDSQKTIERVL
jgi:hypothetical protein